MTLQCSAVRTRADPSRGMWEQMRMLQEVVFYLTPLLKVVGFQGEGEGEAEQPTLSVGGITSNPGPPTMAGKECKARCYGSEQKCGSFQVL